MDAQTNLPGTSLIVCSRNRTTLLTETVESILASNEVPSELIIIDQSNNANSYLANKHMERGCEIRYVWSKKIGLSRGNNLGISLSKHEILAFTHDDVLVAPDWLGSLVRALVQAGARCVVTGQVQPKPERSGGFQLTSKVDPEPAVYTKPGSIDVLLPLNMAAYAAAFCEIGGFDERIGPGTPYPSAEDNDLGLRLFRAGYSIQYVPNAVIYHREWRPEHDFTELRWNYGLGRGAFYAKHFKDPSYYTMRRMFLDVNTHVRTSIQNIRRNQKRSKGDAALVAGMIYGALRWLIVSRTEPDEQNANE